MMKEFGKQSTFLLSIISKEQNSAYGCITLVICDEVVLDSKEGNLSFLCVDLESFENARSKRFQNDFFWSISDEKIMEYWISYFDSKKSIIDFNITYDQFDNLFFQSYIPFKSDFFDDFIFVGFEEMNHFHIKFWKKNNPNKVFNFTLNSKDVFTVSESAALFLREILD